RPLRSALFPYTTLFRSYAASDTDPVAQVLARTQLALEGRLVPEVGERAVKGRKIGAHVATSPQHPPLLRIHQRGEGPQQTRLARAVGTGHLQALAARERETHAPEHVAVAPPEVQVLDVEALIVHEVRCG